MSGVAYFSLVNRMRFDDETVIKFFAGMLFAHSFWPLISYFRFRMIYGEDSAPTRSAMLGYAVYALVLALDLLSSRSDDALRSGMPLLFMKPQAWLEFLHRLAAVWSGDKQNRSFAR